MDHKIKIPLFDLDYGAREEEAVLDVLRNKWLTMGERCRELELQFSQMLGVKHALAVSNGTAALFMAAMALEISTDHRVICPSLSFVATSNCIRYCGASPVFADVVSNDDWTISPDEVLRHLTVKTRGIIVMHYGGFACRMDEIMKIAKDHNLFVIEDCAHAPGSFYDKKPLGSFGDISCFSFFSNKNISTGEGGMVCTNNDELASKLQMLRSHAMTSLSFDRHHGHAFSYDVKGLGFNFRFDEMRAALALVQLDKMSDNNRKRNGLALYYKKRLSVLPQLHIPFLQHNYVSNYHIFPVLLPSGTHRSDIMTFMKEQGVQTSVHYPPIHLFSAYREFFGNHIPHLPVTEEIGRRVLTLPMFPGLSFEDIDYIAGILEQYFEQNSCQ